MLCSAATSANYQTRPKSYVAQPKYTDSLYRMGVQDCDGARFALARRFLQIGTNAGAKRQTVPPSSTRGQALRLAASLSGDGRSLNLDTCEYNMFVRLLTAAALALELAARAHAAHDKRPVIASTIITDITVAFATCVTSPPHTLPPD